MTNDDQRLRRERMIENLLDLNDSEELVRLTEDAKDPKVVGIRQQFKNRGKISDRQDAVLAGWVADERLEYGDPEDEE